jgi:hypothetical protein
MHYASITVNCFTNDDGLDAAAGGAGVEAVVAGLAGQPREA